MDKVVVHEVPWAYDREYSPQPPSPMGDSRLLFFPPHDLQVVDAHLRRDSYSATEMYALGYRLHAVFPRWVGRVYGTSLWVQDESDADAGDAV